ncbi:MAG TPA: hypothetical protein VGG39_30415 [Polyangiaceae bacterium]|jgi:hypothetical protein
MHLTVTSTAARVNGGVVARCAGAAIAQTFTEWHHVYLLADASEADLARLGHPGEPRLFLRPGTRLMLPELAHLWSIWRSLPDDEVVVWLDGRNFFATQHALSIVARAHEAGALATYGQFMWEDGTIGFAAPVESEPRRAPWTATHLMTFRAGLVKRLGEDDLKMPDGRWSFAPDQAVMLPVLEMAGERAHFLPNILCVCSALGADAENARRGPEYVERHPEEVRRIRSRRGYAALSDEECSRMTG